MIVLGYSGLDGSLAYASDVLGAQSGEERMMQGVDSAAAIIIDGKTVAAAAEERFSCERHTGAFPAASLRYCLDAAGIGPDAVDILAHGFDYGRYASIFSFSDPSYYRRVLAPDRQLELCEQHIGWRPARDKFKPVDHHLAHAASAFFPSGFERALCVVCDGMGEVASVSVYAAGPDGFRCLDSLPVRSSIGILFGLVTAHLGFEFNADDKVMDLAPYGDPEVYRNFFAEIVHCNEGGRLAIAFGDIAGSTPFHRAFLDEMHRHVIPRRRARDPIEQSHCDMAASVQEAIETMLFHVIEHWRQRTGFTRLCMAGGMALNCAFTGKLIARDLFDEIYVQPAAGDDGTALGAALCVARAEGDPVAANSQAKGLPFFGPSYAKDVLRRAIACAGNRVEVVEFPSEYAAAEDAATALSQDKIVAWFQGRMEFGPRALGNRSILANPRATDIRQRLNRILKRRADFQPFAPAAISEAAGQYFDYAGQSPFRYMLANCRTRPEWRELLPSVTHIDGSARLQAVEQAQAPLFHHLIQFFGRLIGVACVVNTSFSLRGQPIILSPADAVTTFLACGIDTLYLGPFRLHKP